MTSVCGIWGDGEKDLLTHNIYAMTITSIQRFRHSTLKCKSENHRHSPDSDQNRSPE